eukprot:g2085.t1
MNEEDVLHWLQRRAESCRNRQSQRRMPASEELARKLPRRFADGFWIHEVSQRLHVSPSAGLEEPNHSGSGVLLRVRQRINAAKNLKDYSWQQLFAFCDRDKSGTLDWKEFKHLARETLGVPQEAVCDADLRQLFRRLDQVEDRPGLGLKGGELVDLSELLHYLARGEMEPAVLQARAKQRVERVRRNIMMAFLRPDWKVPGQAFVVKAVELQLKIQAERGALSYFEAEGCMDLQILPCQRVQEGRREYNRCFLG